MIGGRRLANSSPDSDATQGIDFREAGAVWELLVHDCAELISITEPS